MPWQYDQSSGEMRRPDGSLLGTGYSGQLGAGRNNAEMESVPNVGPIPQGQYTIGAAQNSAATGPHVLPLTPVGHTAYGRTAFQIHGEIPAGQPGSGDASTGCIVLSPLGLRQEISNSGDTVLEVVP